MILDQLREIVGSSNLITGDDMARFTSDWAEQVHWSPVAVIKPASTQDVAKVLKLANSAKTPVVPVSGNTGLAAGTSAEGAIMLSLERMNKIHAVSATGRTATVEAGVILANLHTAVDAHDLIFPLTFGARGSAMVGGFLSTNAGGSNVVRYGNTRDLCLGLEVVTPTGEIMNLMSALHKDNSGYDLRHLMIGAEGTLGIITGAVLKLFPKPRAYATAMVATPSVNAGLDLLRRLQQETGGAVEAFEYMPRSFIQGHMQKFPDGREPFDQAYDVNIMVELGALSERDANLNPDGSVPINSNLEEILAAGFEDGQVLDAVVAKSDSERREMWARREAAAEISRLRSPIVDNDVAVPLDKMQELLERIERDVKAIDPDAALLNVAHLGDGNLHFSAWPSTDDRDVMRAIGLAVEEICLDLGGSFSAEHGVGLLKKPAMGRRKDPVAVAMMRKIKTALDPNNILNPGKVIPD